MYAYYYVMYSINDVTMIIDTKYLHGYIGFNFSQGNSQEVVTYHTNQKAEDGENLQHTLYFNFLKNYGYVRFLDWKLECGKCPTVKSHQEMKIHGTWLRLKLVGLAEQSF